MVLTTGPARKRWSTRIRLAILVAVALTSAHAAIYASEDGLGATFAAAMSRDGHDGWWLPAALGIGALGMVLAVAVALHLVRLEVRARGGRRRRTEPTFGAEVIAIARRLIPLVLALFALQENLEQLVAHGRVIGVEAVIGPSHPLAVPVLVLVCLALSMAGAVVRWRVATLRRRLANGPVRTPDRRIRPGTIDPIWRIVGALAPRAGLLQRSDAGRSPPALLQP